MPPTPSKWVKLFTAYHGVKWKWTRCNIHLAPTFLSIWWHGNLKAKNGLVQLGRSCVVHHFHSFFFRGRSRHMCFPFSNFSVLHFPQKNRSILSYSMNEKLLYM
jgi:hypothetical protein